MIALYPQMHAGQRKEMNLGKHLAGLILADWLTSLKAFLIGRMFLQMASRQQRSLARGPCGGGGPAA